MTADYTSADGNGVWIVPEKCRWRSRKNGIQRTRTVSPVGRRALSQYLPLVASVGFLYLWPISVALDWSLYAQLAYCLLLIPLPIFFAGLIFSLGFRMHRDPSFAFGSNLLGAMVGGFVEYAGMVSGTKILLLVILVFYLASFLTNRGLPSPREAFRTF